MIKLHISFLLTLILVIALGYKEQFFIIFLAVTVHELSHILVGFFFGAKLDKISFTALGQVATLKNLDYLTAKKKLCIMVAGPLVNIILWFVLQFIFTNKFIFFRQINMAIFLFNMLPVYPLDGGKIWQIILGNSIGVKNANRLLMRLSKVISKVILVIGVIQVTLYPFNISLICLATYINKVNQKEYINMTFNFYKVVILNNNKVNMKTYLPLKFIIMDKNILIDTVINKLGWDNFYVIYVSDGKKILSIVNEFEIIEYATKNGLNCKLKDMIT